MTIPDGSSILSPQLRGIGSQDANSLFQFPLDPIEEAKFGDSLPQMTSRAILFQLISFPPKGGTSICDLLFLIALDPPVMYLTTIFLLR